MRVGGWHGRGPARGAEHSNMRGFIIGVATTVVIGLICAYSVLQSGLLPANADAKPGGLELWAASASLNATLRASAPKGPNPVALTDANLIEGVKLYGQHCALCHGTADGDASASPVAKGLYPKPPQLATDGVEDDPEGYSYWRIKHGVRLTGMPSWAGTLTDQQIWSIALFLKHMEKLPPGPKATWKQVSN
jgi:thiosulfate dehydrogenase